MRNEREQKYKRVVQMLIDRLAASQTFIDAIDHSMNVFESLEPRKALMVTGMTDSARKAVFEGCGSYFPARVNSGAILTAIAAKEPVNVRESAGYLEIKQRLEDMTRETFNGSA